MEYSLYTTGAVRVSIENRRVQVARSVRRVDPTKPVRPGGEGVYSLFFTPFTVDTHGVTPSLYISGYNGDGRYMVNAQTPGDAFAGPVSSLGVVITEKNTGHEFKVSSTPCSVEIVAGGAFGTALCPKLVDDSGLQISLALKWSSLVPDSTAPAS
jgi:hypothetical protein